MISLVPEAAADGIDLTLRCIVSLSKSKVRTIRSNFFRFTLPTQSDSFAGQIFILPNTKLNVSSHHTNNISKATLQRGQTIINATRHCPKCAHSALLLSRNPLFKQKLCIGLAAALFIPIPDPRLHPSSCRTLHHHPEPPILPDYPSRRVCEDLRFASHLGLTLGREMAS